MKKNSIKAKAGNEVFVINDARSGIFPSMFLYAKQRYAFLALLSTFSVYGGAPSAEDNIKSATERASCIKHDLQLNSNVRVKDIVGMYRQSVAELPAALGDSNEKRTGYNYLAISSKDGNLLRVRLATKEINGHDCGFDSRALLCGSTIQLLPNKADQETLESNNQSIPSLKVTKDHIAFATNSDGTVTSGSPYCGAMGYLRHSFARKTRAGNIATSNFSQ